MNKIRKYIFFSNGEVSLIIGVGENWVIIGDWGISPNYNPTLLCAAEAGHTKNELNKREQPIWITKNNMIVSGHRRVNACKQLGIEEIDCEVREYSETLVIEANRYRTKSKIEIEREWSAVEEIETKKAKQRMVDGGGDRKSEGYISPVKNSSHPKTRDIAAKATGVSHDTIKKIRTIIKEKSEAIKDIDEGKKTVHTVYGGLRNKCHMRQKQPYIPGHLIA